MKTLLVTMIFALLAGLACKNESPANSSMDQSSGQVETSDSVNRTAINEEWMRIKQDLNDLQKRMDQTVEKIDRKMQDAHDEAKVDLQYAKDDLQAWMKQTQLHLQASQDSVISNWTSIEKEVSKLMGDVEAFFKKGI